MGKPLPPEDPNTVLCNLQSVASDDEAMIVEELGIKAGYWWKCSPGDCGCVMPANDAKCSSCGKRKPKAKR